MSEDNFVLVEDDSLPEDENKRDNPLHGRFKDAPWYVQNEVIVLIGGAGGIGSWVALLIARAGFMPFVYDFDELEPHNLSGQIFRKRDIGKSKVEALQEIVKQYCDEDIYVSDQKVDENTPITELCISAFDNMEARTVLFNKWREMYGHDKKAIFIDGRLQAEHMQIFCVEGGNNENIAKYAEEHLFLDSDIKDDETLCTMRQTSHAAAMIASHMVGFFTNHITNVMEGEQGRSVPFYWEYYIPIDFIDH